MEPKVVDEIINAIEKRFGKMTVTRGRHITLWEWI